MANEVVNIETRALLQQKLREWIEEFRNYVNQRYGGMV